MQTRDGPGSSMLVQFQGIKDSSPSTVNVYPQDSGCQDTALGQEHPGVGGGLVGMVIPSAIAIFPLEEPGQAKHALRKKAAKPGPQSNCSYSFYSLLHNYIPEGTASKPFPQVRKISCQLNAAGRPRLKDHSDHVTPLSWVSGSQEYT